MTLLRSLNVLVSFITCTALEEWDKMEEINNSSAPVGLKVNKLLYFSNRSSRCHTWAVVGILETLLKYLINYSITVDDYSTIYDSNCDLIQKQNFSKLYSFCHLLTLCIRNVKVTQNYHIFHLNVNWSQFLILRKIWKLSL